MFAKILLISAVFCIAFANIPEHHHHHAQPYKFGYEVKDHHGSQHRHEHGDGHGNVQGSYGFTDDRGIHREVHYTADHNGFRAQVKTNEPGTANQNPAAVHIHSSAPHHDHGHHHAHHDHGHHHQVHHHGQQQVYHHQGHHNHGHHHGHVYHHQSHPHGHHGHHV